MKLPFVLLCLAVLTVAAATDEEINKRFPVQAGGRLVVDVDVGSLEVTTNATSEVVVNVYRKIGRSSKAAEETYLREHPVIFKQDGNTVSVTVEETPQPRRNSSGNNRNDVRYTISVPAKFDARLKTSGGGITISDLTGEVNADTSSGAIRLANCEGMLKINTSGGDINVSGGKGTLVGETSGGSIAVRDFKGPTHVHTSGGDIRIEKVAGDIKASTSGGSVSASLPALAGDVSLQTSGGGVTFRVPRNAAFDLDATTSGGNVSSAIPVASAGKPNRQQLKGPVNGGGKAVRLHTDGGSVRVEKL